METEVLIIGAGAIGLACGAELARRGRSVLLIEQHAGPGQETSSHNSEVIHSGLYYPTSSLKAELCVKGREILYARCTRLNLPHHRCGKLIIATRNAEVGTLENLLHRGTQNGAGALELIDARELARREPRVRGVAALWSPESGIVDTQALLASYQAELSASGGTIAFRTKAVGLEQTAAGWRAETRGPNGERFKIEAPTVVNAAGLAADHIAALAGIDVDRSKLRQHPCKGDYFAITPGLGMPTRHLVYPLPEPGGLGIHVTFDLGGRYKLGPDATWVETPDYRIDPGKAKAFAAAAARYLPELRPEHLSPDYAGIRPKLQPPGGGFRDFHLAEAGGLGAPGLVNLLGIESPGLTAAGAIALQIAELLRI